MHYSSCNKIQKSKEGDVDTRKTFWEDCASHLMQPEGFLLLGGYLIGTWMFRLMPASYYTREGGVNPVHLFLQLAVNDCFQTIMHMGEHKLSPKIYQKSHKPHHKFLNPKMFDAFNGSLTDTICMILVPLFLTANVSFALRKLVNSFMVKSLQSRSFTVKPANRERQSRENTEVCRVCLLFPQLIHCNVWTYMAFGTTYSAWLTLIHSETTHPWDAAFRKLGLGTAGDHHVHHKCFIYNYGHLFMWWDMIAGTYRSPLAIDSFCKDI